MESPIEQKSPDDTWNFWTFVMLLVTHRAGWILKLESVIMPAFLDALGGSGVTRSLLPVLSRIGTGLPQFLIVHRVERLPRLKGALAILTFVEGAPWLLLGLAYGWGVPLTGVSGQATFLLLYALFCSVNGMTFLIQGLLQGKLVDPYRRGRLLAFATVGGSTAGIAAVFLWMLPNLKAEAGAAGFGPVFLVTGVFFAITAIVTAVLRENPASLETGPSRFRQFLSNTWQELAREPRFRFLVLVVSLYYVFLLLFPHYASYGQVVLGAGSGDLVAWVVVQNIGFALISVVLGNFADRKGYRLALLAIVLGLAIVPLLAVAVGFFPSPLNRKLYWLVFFLLGCAPASQRILTNYVLEFAPVGRESMYLGTVNLVQLLPLAGAPLVGWAMDKWSYQPVFLAGAVVLFIAVWLGTKLPEPRTAA